MNQVAVKVDRLIEPHRHPETQKLLEQYVEARVAAGEPITPNPIWYWLDHNADHGAGPRVISWFLGDAERYELLLAARKRRS